VLAFIPDKVQPPSAVVRDYHDVLAAREQQLQLLQGVEGERIKQMLQSNNHVLQVLSESTISGIEKRLTAEGEAAYFEQVAKSYQQQPLMVELNRRLEVMEKVLPAMDKVLVSPDIATDDRRVWSEAE
jgi:membrane protease subunit HflK